MLLGLGSADLSTGRLGRLSRLHLLQTLLIVVEGDVHAGHLWLFCVVVLSNQRSLIIQQINLIITVLLVFPEHMILELKQVFGHLVQAPLLRLVICHYHQLALWSRLRLLARIWHVKITFVLLRVQLISLQRMLAPLAHLLLLYDFAEWV